MVKFKNVINDLFDFSKEISYVDDRTIEGLTEEGKKKFEEITKGHSKEGTKILSIASIEEGYEEELSKYFDNLTRDIRPFSKNLSENIPVEFYSDVNNFFAQYYGFDSYNDLLIFASKNFSPNEEISIDKILELKNKLEEETEVIIDSNEPVQTDDNIKNTEEKEVKNNKEQAGKNTSEEAHKAEETAKNAESKPTKELEPVDYIDVESKNVEEKPQQQASSETIEPNKTEETKPSTEEKETKKSEPVKQKENNTKETNNNSTSTEKPNTSNSEPTREPSIDVNNTKDVRTTKPIYTTNTEPKINTKVIGQEAKEALEKGVEKHLKGTGIIAAAAIVGGLFIHHEHEKKKENRNTEPDYLTGSSRSKIFWNQNNTARLAKDVSSYRYGSRMSGYI